MSEKRLVVYFMFGIILSLIVLSGILIFFEKGGWAEFEILGQKFSSTNIGLAVLFLAIVIFAYIVRENYKSGYEDRKGNKVYKFPTRDGIITWNEVIGGAEKLVLQLTSSTGFRPDLVIGICGGGLVVADIVSKRLGHVPCIAIWPNRHSSTEKSKFSGQAKTINKIDFDGIISENSMKRILLVDDVVYSGDTLGAAFEYVKSVSKLIQKSEAEIRTASLFALTSSKHRPDFVAMMDATDRRMMPVSDRLRQRGS